jgi:xylan 1,4-beta-xylosidase
MHIHSAHALAIAMTLFFVATTADAQVDLTVGKTRPKNPAISRASGPRSEPTKTGTPENYSGLSGPGQPVEGTGFGGYRSGNEGLMYKGPEPKEGWLSFGNRARGEAVSNGLLPPIRPIWDLHLRDTIINMDDKGNYFMTGSSGDNIWDINDGVELWKSKDLKTWEYLGLVWSVDRDGTWEKQYRRLWAPEIHFVKNNFYITYCMQGGGTGLLKSKTGKPEGPYVNAISSGEPLTQQIDATMFADDDGKVYFTAGSGSSISLMKDDMSGFAESTKIEVNVDSEPGGFTRLGHEGVCLFKANGKYYLTAADTYQGRYSSIATISDNVLGPYSKVHEAVPCGAGGNYFKDKDGNWWCTYFGNDDQSPWREKPGLVKIDFNKDGKIFVADEQPAFVLQPGVPTKWRNKTPAPSTSSEPASATTAAPTTTPVENTQQP